jgi:hypothetical protein
MAPLKKYGGIGPLHFYYYLMYIIIPIMQIGHYDVEYGTVRYHQISVLYMYLYRYRVPVPVPVPMHVELFWHKFPSHGSTSSFTKYTVETVAVFSQP